MPQALAAAAVQRRARGPQAAQPQAARGPRHMQVNLQRLDDGRLRLSTPQARGAAYCARGPMQVWNALAALYRDAASAGAAAWRGERTELDWLTAEDDPTEPSRRNLPAPGEIAAVRAVSYSYRSVVRPDQADPATWEPLEPQQRDGREVRPWRSPNGRTWTSEKVLRPLIAKRELLGLPTTWEEAQQAEAAQEASA